MVPSEPHVSAVNAPRGPLSRDPLAWPARLGLCAAGLLAGASLAGGPIHAGSAVVVSGLAAAVWGTDNAVSMRWPRARRPQWAARMMLLASLLLALRLELGGVGAAALAGASVGIAARERGPRFAADGVIATSMGLLLGLASALALAERATLAITLVASLGAAMALLVATFRGGPGRAPVRPVDVAWLYVLGAATALALALPR